MRSKLCAVMIFMLALGALTAAADAETWRFTVTADPRGHHSAFGDTLQAMNNLVFGPGAFHVSCGDVDNTIPENRAQIDAKSGPGAIWYPIIGNHEEETGADMRWLRAEYDNGNGVRTPLSDPTMTNADGPVGTKRTCYTWDYGNAHFVALNQYWNGGPNEGTGSSTSGDDTRANGDVVGALRAWLAADLAANTKPYVFVFGHEPAYPYSWQRHHGDSLDQHPANRDAFWNLLEGVTVPGQSATAYFCGHTHQYAIRNVGGVWQIDAGAAGNGSVETFVDVEFGTTEVTYSTYNNSGGWHLVESWSEPIPEPATMALLGLGAVALLARRRR